MSGQLWPCASWCTDKDRPGHETCAYRPGDRSKPVVVALLRDRCRWRDEPQRPPWVHIIAREPSGTHYESALLEIPAAADLAPILAILRHRYLAEAIHSAIATSGAVLTETGYGTQKWEVPA